MLRAGFTNGAVFCTLSASQIAGLTTIVPATTGSNVAIFRRRSSADRFSVIASTMWMSSNRAAFSEPASMATRVGGPMPATPAPPEWQFGSANNIRMTPFNYMHYCYTFFVLFG